jgi:hypothetical protein
MSQSIAHQKAVLVDSSVDDPSRRPYGDHALVLEEAIEEQLLNSTPTMICCPNCAEPVETFDTGVPAAVPQFDEPCSECSANLRHWNAVAVDAAYVDIVESSKLAELTQAYWNTKLNAGITNARDGPRNDEYSELFDMVATAYQWDWSPTCPLCRRSQPKYDYHHWRETPDQGVVLCRECHDIIGFDMPDYQLEEYVRKNGLSSRSDAQVLRLALRDAIVTERRLQPTMAEYLVKRYNLMQTPAEVTALIEALYNSDELYQEIVDDRLWDGFNH